MRKTLLILAFTVIAGPAQAQIKCWTENGKRVCGDTPPAGAKTTTIRTESSSGMSPPAAAKGAAKEDEKKGPLTAAEKEAEAKKQQAEDKKKAEKAEIDKKNELARRENCERAGAAMRQLESGQRIQRFDAKGERYFLEDSQREAETARARQTQQEACK